MRALMRVWIALATLMCGVGVAWADNVANPEEWGVPGLTVGESPEKAGQLFKKAGLALARTDKITPSNSKKVYKIAYPSPQDAGELLFGSDTLDPVQTLEFRRQYSGYQEAKASFDKWHKKFASEFGPGKLVDTNDMLLARFCVSEHVIVQELFFEKTKVLFVASRETPLTDPLCKGAKHSKPGNLFDVIPVPARP